MAPFAPHVTRRSLLCGLAATAALPAAARAPERSLFPRARASVRGPVNGLAAHSAERLLQDADLGGATGFIAIDAESGDVLEEYGADTALPPASVAKAATAMFGLHTLGMEYRFLTRVLARGGAVTGGVLRGDLVLQGGGDPMLQTEDLARLADRLVDSGLRRVEGRFLVDESALPRIGAIAPDQPVEAGYNPAISGLNLNYNRVHFQWARSGDGMELTMDARSPREVPRVSVIGIEAQERAMPVYTYDEQAEREFWTVSRAALGNGGSRWLPVRRPGPYTGDVLRALLVARGCTVPAPQRATGAGSGAILAEHRSMQMSELMRVMLRYSTNLAAECVGLSAARRLEPGTHGLQQSGQAMTRWLTRHYGVRNLQFVDHSGLGDTARVTARSMAEFFLAAGREGILPGLLRQHVMRDSQGRPMDNHPVDVRAKTGTLNFVSGLGGYAQTPGGRDIVFAIFSGDLDRRAAIPVEARDRPAGARGWARRARALQQGLIERWSATYG
ncbi:MAG: D-alanyl-D-alanine carboxypeptidase/D-alanyl-D-alanine-endopeptidase [Rhodobacteraceae bacterium HLUCCA12]|nr:MAG: D-alanyl-D-alanine carboxypeptidase/D-alanyl-D-alanine-endopeptidase [Rhodobacteraceae bacterium HLUCCA12]